MPTEFLLPAFALVLLANAVLVAAAMRALWGGRQDPGAARHATSSAPPPSSGPPIAEPDRQPSAGSETSPAGTPGHEPPPPPATTPEPPRPAARRRAAARAAGATTTRTPARSPRPSTGGRRGRRRFSLPPLDEDHEKVNRSIESFLSSGDTTDPVVGDGQPESPSARPTASSGATTVALVAVDGLGHPGDDATLATLERTLRANARGTDVVTVGKHGRYRVVLKGTGELAARAYLRRFRAAIEPVLAAADGRLRLRVATATILGGPLRSAVELAERRLAALAEVTQPDRAVSPSIADVGDARGSDEADRTDDLDQAIEPRAAGD